MKRLQERLQKAETERGGLKGEQGDNDVELLQQQAAELDLQGEELQEQLEQLQPKIGEQRDATRHDSDELDSARSALQSLRGRMASLEALQQAALGQGDKAVSEWLNSHQLANNPRVAESLQVEDKWQNAVETVLGDQLQALCLDNIESLSPLLADLERGALNFFEPAGNASNKPGTLAEVVSGHSALCAQLNHVYLAEDLAEALQRRAGLDAHESIVTPEGLLIGRNSLRVSRGDNAQSGILARQEELQELEAQIAETQERVSRLQQQLENGRDQQKLLEEQRDGLQREIQQHSRQQAELRSQLSAQQARIEQISARRQGLDTEIADLAGQFKAEQESLAEARMSLSEAIESMEQDAGQREQLLGERDQNRSALDEARQKARHSKDHAHQLAMRHQSLQTQRDSCLAGISRTEEQLAQLQEQYETLQLNLGEVDAPVEDLKIELEAKLEQRLAVEEELAEARRNLEAVDHQLREHEQKRHGIEQRLQQVAGQLEQARVDSQGLQVRRKGLLDQLQEAQFDLDSVRESLPEEAREADWQQQLEAVGRRIDRLGPINLAAIEEYKQQSERKNYLDSQNQDLVDALETLEAAIRRIDKETRNRFKETFDKVNSGLQSLFPKVFGGGSAYLEMTGDDLLNTGISIMARPPGKRNATIHLLSGGEKALTAIALVFSIFRLNPAPFCMLDEVDAPLDDANVGRYSRMVKEMSSEVQFIYISHNKIAMEMADQLMGVTMHEPGVSRLVSVDIEKAAELAAS